MRRVLCVFALALAACNADGRRVPTCAPDCSAKSCGDDGCGGSCGDCPVKSPVCLDASTLRTYASTCGGDAACRATHADAKCPNGCARGACVGGGGCTPGASCTVPGECLLGVTVCEGGKGTCVAKPAPDGTACGGGRSCEGGQCVACKQGAACQPTDPCRTGTLDCVSGTPVCNAGGSALDGTPCGANGEVCSGGACSACTAGKACTPDSPCRVGQTSCASGQSSCADTGVSLADGTSCGGGQSCFGGVCASCTEGASCVPDGAPCDVGALSCSGGTPTCVDRFTPQPDGASCGPGDVCFNGGCGACSAGTACVPPSAPCHTGVVACDTGLPACADEGAGLADGTACGASMVCSGGACISCTEGAACAPANPCHAGATSCASGAPTCADSGSALGDGAPCGAGQVCRGGSCVACAAGAGCTPSNPCHVGVVACDTGVPVCADTFSPLGDGTTCGSNAICNSGACEVCAAGVACTPSNPCHAGAVACRAGVSSCVDTGNAIANGAACGFDQVCDGGSCVTCYAGASCRSSNACHVGVYSCATGVQACLDTGTPSFDGTSCGADKVCRSGLCATCGGGGACTEGAPACQAGVYACPSGPKSCGPPYTPIADLTVCGTNEICLGGGCASCINNAACKPANPCHTGYLTCNGSAAATCTDAGGTQPDGLSCGMGQVCRSGGCQSGCFIGGVVRAPGDVNPQNPCETCQPAKSTTSYTPLADGTLCGAASGCERDRCVAGCVVGGTFYVDQTVNPANPCQACRTAASATAWTTLQKFGAPRNTSMPDNVDSFVLADFNANGKPDYAALDHTGQRVMISLDGSSAIATYPSGGALLGTRLVAAQLDRDHRTDLVAFPATDSKTLAVLFDDGQGGLQAPTYFQVAATASQIDDVIAADLEGNGWPDLVVADNSGVVWVMKNLQNGHFAPGVATQTGASVQRLAAGDFNGDGKLDIAAVLYKTGNFGPTYVLAPLNGNGDGTLQPATQELALTSGNEFVHNLAVGDVNGDGVDDLVAPGGTTSSGWDNTYGFQVHLALGGKTGMTLPRSGALGGAADWPGGVALGDFNGDGKLDIAVGGYYNANVYVYLGAGQGAFGAPTAFPTSGLNGNGLYAVDTNGDGKLDLVYGLQSSDAYAVLPNVCP